MQLTFPPELSRFVQQQISSGKYQNQHELILAAVQLLQQQEDIYQGRLLELQRDALVGWDALQAGQVSDGSTAIAQIRSNLQEKYGSSEG